MLVIKDGNIRLVNIKNQDTVIRLLDMIPELSAKFSELLGKGDKEKKTEKSDKDMPKTEEEVSEKLDKEKN